MKSLIPSFAVLLIAICAQGQRTPGRVGGTVNNPPAETRTQKQIGPGDVSALTPEQKQEFEQAKKQIPNLTVYDFLVLRAAAQSIQQVKPEGGSVNSLTSSAHGGVEVGALAAKVAANNNDPIAAIAAFGLDPAQAKAVYKKAKSKAKAQLAAQSK
jgi:hypothetical protein